MNETLLDIINDILLDMNELRVNTLGATPAAERVQNILRDVYFELVSRRLWPANGRHIQLLSASDSDKPTKLLVPDNVSDIEYIRYNVAAPGEPAQYVLLVHKYPEDFLQLTYTRNSTDPATVEVETEDGAKFFVLNNQSPRYWTSFDERSIYVDSYDSTKESTLQGHNTVAFVYKEPEWPTTDTGTLDMPPRYVPMFKALAKAVCFEKIKQIQSPHDEIWGRALYGRLIHEGSRTEQDRPRKARYGKRARGHYIPRK